MDSILFGDGNQNSNGESPLINGALPGYHTFDAQVSDHIPKIKTTIRTGGSNIFNNRYIQYAAGQTIGGWFYSAITLDGVLNN